MASPVCAQASATRGARLPIAAALAGSRRPAAGAKVAAPSRPRGVAMVMACSAGPPLRPLRPVEERFRIQVERNVDEARLQQLNVRRWAKWESDVAEFDHEWQVDEQVFIVKGTVRVVPDDCDDCAFFYAGDLVRFPKWFSASLSFDGEFEQRYRFLAYGDD